MRRLQIHAALDRQIVYDGSQLEPHFIRRTFGIAGDAAVAFRGPCDVPPAALVDLEDREARAFIRAREMLHLLVERFEPKLVRMVLIQRLLAALVAGRVQRTLQPPFAAAAVRRIDDDVYVGEGKLTVSIATVSPVSGLIHFGINIDDHGAPVRTASLAALGIEPDSFARGILEELRDELEGVAGAVAKVAPVYGVRDHP